MNLPNKLTLLRVALIPVFVALMMLEGNLFQLLAAAVFVLASLTDYWDGRYARKHDMITDFGKLMDPMADKLLVMAALVGLVAQGRAPYLACMVILGREFVISSIRLVAASKGVVIAADKLGKYKTASQMAAILLLLVAPVWGSFFLVAGEALLWISVALSVWSCVAYIVHNKGVFQ